MDGLAFVVVSIQVVGVELSEIPVRIEIQDLAPSRQRVVLEIQNSLDRAICIPGYLVPLSRAEFRSLDFFEVYAEESGERIQTSSRRLHRPDIVDTFVAVPPGEKRIFSDHLSDFYPLLEGTRYRVSYDQQAFYCDALNGGYPIRHPRTRYLDANEESLFLRTPETTVRMVGEASF